MADPYQGLAAPTQVEKVVVQNIGKWRQHVKGKRNEIDKSRKESIWIEHCKTYLVDALQSHTRKVERWEVAWGSRNKVETPKARRVEGAKPAEGC